MHEFVQALRLMKRPLVVLATLLLTMQALLGALVGAHAAANATARLALGDGIILCHGVNDSPPSDTVPSAVHDCCAVCTSGSGPLALATVPVPMQWLLPMKGAVTAVAIPDVRLSGRTIRAGPSQAPPVA